MLLTLLTQKGWETTPFVSSPLRKVKEMRRTVLLLASVALAVLLAGGGALAASPEDLDPSFDGDGRVVTDFSSPENPGAEGAYDVVVQPDGKIVAGGFAMAGGSDDFALARYNTDGSLDDSFDGDGRVTTDLAGGNDRVVAVGVQSDGKIVAVGRVGWGEPWMARYNTDGSLDDSFDEDGKMPLNPSGADDGVTYVTDLAIQEDDKVVVAGDNEGFDLTLTRYNGDGSLDDSFDEDGKLTGQFDQQNGSARALAIQPDGKIVLVGIAQEDYNDTGLARYNTDGSPDASFAGDGTLATSFTGEDDEGWGVAIQPDGKIVVAVDSYYGAALRRFEADGSLDKGFGEDGTALNTAVSGYSDLALQEDGKIVALNSCPYCFRNEVWGVTRHNTDGSIDPSLRFKFGWGQDERPGANAMALQPDGKVILAGGLLDDEDSLVDFRLTRHLGASFQDDTKPTGSVTIEGGRASTKDRTVRLTLEAKDPGSNSSGVSRMRLKNGGGDWTKWLSYERRKTWRLTPGAGTKTVYVQYEDLMGNVSAAASDSIRYRP
jgi:uncharacterized delta-60 repeat protein